uniref:Uncharacterized protein n=1 Tax=uncultured marine virus TaxID=186617 RepID=A0A0F7L4H7_9VIRU|nr:hypothetical protein [uncultured marine virus]
MVSDYTRANSAWDIPNSVCGVFIRVWTIRMVYIIPISNQNAMKPTIIRKQKEQDDYFYNNKN